MTDPKTAIVDELVGVLRSAAQEAGVALKDDLTEVTAFAQERVDHLAQIIGQPGYEQAVRYERDAILLRAAASAVDSADEIDRRVTSALIGAIRVGVRALAVMV